VCRCIHTHLCTPIPTYTHLYTPIHTYASRPRCTFLLPTVLYVCLTARVHVCPAHAHAMGRMWHVEQGTWGIIERDFEHETLVHHSIAWAKLSHIVRVPGAAGVGERGGKGEGQEAAWRGREAALLRVALCCADGRVHVYESAERDGVVASLVDAAAMQGMWLPVSADVMAEGWSVGGISAEGDKEYEDALMERLSTPPVKDEDIWQWVEMAHECNSNLSANAGTLPSPLPDRPSPAV